MMQLQALERKRPSDDQINWVTAFFMAAFHLGAVAALLGRLPSYRMQVSSIDAAARLVVAGLGLAILPLEVATPHAGAGRKHCRPHANAAKSSNPTPLTAAARLAVGRAAASMEETSNDVSAESAKRRPKTQNPPDIVFLQVKSA